MKDLASLPGNVRLSTILFYLVPLDEVYNAGRHAKIDIRDVKPPISITTIFLQSLVINLNFADKPIVAGIATPKSKVNRAYARKGIPKLLTSCSDARLEVEAPQDSGSSRHGDVRQGKQPLSYQVNS